MNVSTRLLSRSWADATVLAPLVPMGRIYKGAPGLKHLFTLRHHQDVMNPSKDEAILPFHGFDLSRQHPRPLLGACYVSDNWRQIFLFSLLRASGLTMNTTRQPRPLHAFQTLQSQHQEPGLSALQPLPSLDTLLQPRQPLTDLSTYTDQQAADRLNSNVDEVFNLRRHLDLEESNPEQASLVDTIRQVIQQIGHEDERLLEHRRFLQRQPGQGRQGGAQ